MLVLPSPPASCRCPHPLLPSSVASGLADGATGIDGIGGAGSGVVASGVRGGVVIGTTVVVIGMGVVVGTGYMGMARYTVMVGCTGIASLMSFIELASLASETSSILIYEEEDNFIAL